MGVEIQFKPQHWVSPVFCLERIHPSRPQEKLKPKPTLLQVFAGETHSHKRGNTLNFVKAVLGSQISLLLNHMGRNLQMKLVREEEQADMSSPLFQRSLSPRQPTIQMNLTLLTFLRYREWPLESNPEMQGIQSRSYREMGKAGPSWIQFTVQRHHII